nr:PREDICTED: 26S proteasome non-ATPase regulatory subunit 4 [Opisthocomus hoazin]
MRNGDFLPTRLQAQQDAVNIVCHSKTRSNPENNVGLITLANNCEVLTTLTPDTGRILSKLHTVQPKGKITFCTGIRVAHLALKHRQGKNHKMRIIAFVGSPVEDNEKDLVKLAKRLKKEKVNVDIINFGEEVRLLPRFWHKIQGRILYPPQPRARTRARWNDNSAPAELPFLCRPPLRPERRVKRQYAVALFTSSPAMPQRDLVSEVEMAVEAQRSSPKGAARPWAAPACEGCCPGLRRGALSQGRCALPAAAISRSFLRPGEAGASRRGEMGA